LRSNLDVAGLKAQVLGRIEELEAREREREELLSELVPVLEARGYEAGAVKAALQEDGTRARPCRGRAGREPLERGRPTPKSQCTPCPEVAHLPGGQFWSRTSENNPSTHFGE